MQKATRNQRNPRQRKGAKSQRRPPARGRGRGGMSLSFRSSPAIQSPVPYQFWTKMIASGSFYTGSGAATGDYNWSFNLNSPYLPFANVTTGVTWNGVNPATYTAVGMATLMKSTYYTLIQVYKSKIELDIVPQSVTDSVVCCVTASDSSGNPSSIGTAMGKPWTKTMRFSSGRTNRQGDYPLRYTCSLPKFFGIKPQIYENDTSGAYVGGYNVLPAINIPWVLNVETGDNAVLGFALEVSIRITYSVKCYGLASQSVAEISPDASEPLYWHYTPTGRIAVREDARRARLFKSFEKKEYPDLAAGLKSLHLSQEEKERLWEADKPKEFSDEETDSPFTHVPDDWAPPVRRRAPREELVNNDHVETDRGIFPSLHLPFNAEEYKKEKIARGELSPKHRRKPRITAVAVPTNP